MSFWKGLAQSSLLVPQKTMLAHEVSVEQTQPARFMQFDLLSATSVTITKKATMKLQLFRSFCALRYNPLLNVKILDQSKFKVSAGNKLKVILMAKFVLEKTENIVGKEENAGYQHFLLLPQCLQTACSSGSLKVGIVW